MTQDVESGGPQEKMISLPVIRDSISASALTQGPHLQDS